MMTSGDTRCKPTVSLENLLYVSVRVQVSAVGAKYARKMAIQLPYRSVARDRAGIGSIVSWS